MQWRSVLSGITFGLILFACVAFPGCVDRWVEDTPMGIYAEDWGK